jgi:uncharacterized protein YbcI
MADLTQGPRIGDDELDAVTDAMVALHERYHGRRPVTARTQMLGDDMLACVLGDVYTDVEKTMIELQRQAVVQDTRGAFEHATQQRFIRAVERLTGLRVLRFLTMHHVGPDLEILLFFIQSDQKARSEWYLG